jgi:hypothetical protein
MKKHRVVLTSVLGLILAAGAIGIAQQVPAGGVQTSHHENLAAAQQLIKEAYQKIEAAQQANKDELGGHAKKAEQLLDQANQELGLAAEYANQHAKHR